MWRQRLPFAVRVELARVRRWPRWLLERGAIAQVGEAPAGDFVLARHTSPLRRSKTVSDEALQAGKETNVRRVASAIDGTVMAPGQVFSYHHRVGRPARWRGFVPGPELHGGTLEAGVGGGACQVSNLLFLLALRGGLTIVERHRHSLDLFPDEQRTVPFGCGATVFYNLADLRFANPFDAPVSVHLGVEGGHLVGEFRAADDPGIRVEVYEDHQRFVRRGDTIFRENALRRRIVSYPVRTLLIDHLVAENSARVCYPVDEEALDVTSDNERAA